MSDSTPLDRLEGRCGFPPTGEGAAEYAKRAKEIPHAPICDYHLAQAPPETALTNYE